MHASRKTIRIATGLLFALAAAVLAGFLCACSSSQEDIAAASSDAITSIEDLKGKKVGALSGTLSVDTAATVAGESGEVLMFNSSPEMAAALDAGKIDAYITDYTISLSLLDTYPGHKQVGEMIERFDLVLMISPSSWRGDQLCSQLNDYIAKISADGTLEELQQIWISPGDADKQKVDIPTESDSGTTIAVAVSTQAGSPHSYVVDGKYAGYDLDVLAHFCKEYGYALEISDMDFSGALSAVAAGKCDVAACGISRTAEREESFLMTDSIYDNGSVCIVKQAESEKVGLLARLANSINKTFITESRWQYFLLGIWNTLLITFGAVIIGTLLGFAVYLACRRGGKVVSLITRFCMWFIDGMPIVVLLMVLFYVVFARVNVSGLAVSVIAFSLVFAATVTGLLKEAVDSVDPEQEKAARAMGFSRSQAFFQIVLPQAVRLGLSRYETEVLALFKGTTVVGYIAVRDLTQIGDMIRNWTYEAFFPLVAVAVFYFVLAALIKFILRRLARKLDPLNKDRSEFLEGIDLQSWKGRTGSTGGSDD